MKSSNIAILKIKNPDYCGIINKSKKINSMQNIDVTKKVEHYKKLLKINIKRTFWCCKFTTNSNLIEKGEIYKLKW